MHDIMRSKNVHLHCCTIRWALWRLWSGTPIRNTRCCCQPLTGVPYLRPGPRTFGGASLFLGSRAQACVLWGCVSCRALQAMVLEQGGRSLEIPKNGKVNRPFRRFSPQTRNAYPAVPSTTRGYHMGWCRTCSRSSSIVHWHHHARMEQVALPGFGDPCPDLPKRLVIECIRSGGGTWVSRHTYKESSKVRVSKRVE